MKPSLLMLAACLLLACGDESKTDPAPAPTRADAMTAIDMAAGELPSPEARIDLCGAATCAADEICVRPCCTGAGCTPAPPHCLPAPPACGQANACSCFDEDPCRDFGASCPGVAGGEVICTCS